MAGDWIKMRSNLWDDPRVARLCDMTDSSEAAVVGGLYWLWATADQHSINGHLPGLTVRQLDRKTGIAGLGDALLAVGWLAVEGDGLTIPSFEEHNGSSAKKRAQTARRVAVCKSKGSAVIEPELSSFDQTVTRQQHETTDSGNAHSVSGALPREREREEEIQGCKHPPAQSPSATAAEPLAAPPPATATSAGLPACPVDQLVGLYHEVLPELPRCRLMPDARAKLLRRRWRWVLSSRKPDGTRRASSAAEGLAWFGSFFERARASDWLMGRSARGAGHEGWQCDLDFLLSDKGLKAVVEKTEALAA